MSTVWLLYEIKVYIETSTLPVREMVRGMNKIEIVTLMTDHMMDINRKAGAIAGFNAEEYNKQIEALYPNIYSINNSVFDLLKSKGLINSVE